MIVIVCPVQEAQCQMLVMHTTPPLPPASSQEKLWTSDTKSNNCLFEVKGAYIFYFLLILSKSVI